VANATPGGNQAKSDPSQFDLPHIALPKGGGAIQGIGEKFSTNLMTGTGAVTVPMAVSSARSGFDPQLAIKYDSGSGNSIFGMGWNLDLPSISLKTDKGLPQYRGGDVYLISGAEDLVPQLKRAHDGEWITDETERDGHCIRLFRPRVEGLFSRIERWTRRCDGDVHWRSYTKDSVLTVYGVDESSRISDPERPLHIFQWLVSASYDGKGNAIRYAYASEDHAGCGWGRRGVNRYPKRIFYGNRIPRLGPDENNDDIGWMFEVVLDYGEEGYESSAQPEGEWARIDEPHEKRDWLIRDDPFSAYRSGFEIRTNRLCRRALLFHRFPDELGTPRYLVRSTEFLYEGKRIGSLLTGVVQSGYTLETDGSYLKRSLPLLEFSYSASPLEEKQPGPFELGEADAENLPTGIEGAAYHWADLDGEGISGILSEQGGGWYYKRNLGNGRFGAVELVRRKPVSSNLSGAQQLLDLGDEGQMDLVSLVAGSAGFYERVAPGGGWSGLESGWGAFRPFRALPVLDWSDPNLRFVDLTGDGIADILITEDVALRWHPSLREEGFDLAVRIPSPGDEKEGPRVVFSDPLQSIYLADMSGDGLSDIVRIRNGEVCYWPNLGYGRFGGKIVMGGSPWFDEPGLFDNRRVRLADTDGSGTTDILYLAANEVHAYLNESGNSLSGRRVLRGLPAPATHAISVVDFLGRGTACLVWSSYILADSQRPLRYVDLMRGRKPHLLTSIANHLGSETRIEYASSTEFYLADKEQGCPWVTPLPFPVHVVKRVETYDHVSKTRLVSTSSFHHGYFDGVEREFRGFGRVDRMDAEEFDIGASASFAATLNEDEAWRLAPVLTKTWYHTGVFLGVDRVSRHLEHEYYREPSERTQILLDDTILPAGLTPEEAREACRALKGSKLREEVYALDGSKASSRPYSVVESNSTIRMLQPRGENLHGVFFVHAREVVTANYERKLYRFAGELRADPRVSHACTLDVDDYGNVLKFVTIAYGRRFPEDSPHLTAADHAEQAKQQATLTDNRYTNAVNSPYAYRAPRLAEARTFELPRVRLTGRRARLLSFEEVQRQAVITGDGGHDLPFEDVHAEGAKEAGPYRRLIQNARTLFRSDSLEGLLPLGRLESLALPGESYTLVFTRGLIARVLGDKLQGEFPEACGYVDLDGDGNRWTPTGRMFYSPDADAGPAEELREARRHFFLMRRYRDPFGNVSHVDYDTHDLVPVGTRDPLDNVVRAELDYRTMQPRLITDPNGNQSQAAYDALGLLAGTAAMGKPGENLGDSLEGFVADLPSAEVLRHIRNPLDSPEAILGNATVRLAYDLFAFDRTRHESQPQPAVIYSLSRETHVSYLAPAAQTKIQHAFAYSDGLGRVVQKKIQAEPGPIPGRGSTVVDPRWVGSGWTIFNNKGKPVRQYEPFFTFTQQFEFAAKAGVTPTLIYDPLERVVATLSPNHTFQKTVFDPWQQEMWDVNDTVLSNPADDPDIGAFLRFLPAEEYLPTWYEQRVNGKLGPREQEAAWKTAAHAGTPSLIFVDSFGRALLTVAHNRFRREEEIVDEFYPTRFRLDIRGNVLAVTDALGRVIATYDYDLANRKVHQVSADKGKYWTLNDLASKPVLAFDSRGFRLRYEYDELRRPKALCVRSRAGAEKLAERIEFGESQPDAERNNLRGRMYRQQDEAGVLTTPEYDFKGNLLRSSRQMLAEYRTMPDRASSPELEADVFGSATTYDALNRPTELTAPDRSVVRPTYNEANLLETLEVSLKGPAALRPFVTNIDYNAKGQRELIEYGSGARTANSYDPLTFRLTHILTSRASDGAVLQDLSYTYDASGNMSFVADRAQQTVYFNNQVMAANSDYIYDATYRLIQASGREHAGNTGYPQTDFNDFARVHLPLPGDSRAMRHYRERYRYDSVGNILELLHSAGADGSWRRSYEYEEIGLNNRLTSTTVGQQENRYAYDANGNMLRMQHLPSMTWDFRNQLASTQTQIRADGGQAETTYYAYDIGGQRGRKVTVDSAGRRRADRMYIGGGFEMYREFAASGDVELERTTLHVMDNQRRVAMVESRGEEIRVRHQFDNHLGSSCLELDEAAAVISYEEYYPFGSTSYQAGRSLAEVSLKRYRFTKKERDAETGFYYHGARYYAPWLGRWTSPDPEGLFDGPDLFVFVKNNPVRLTDPTGREGFYGDPGMDVVMRQMSGEVEGMIESVAGGHAYVDVASNRVEYTGPTGGVGGMWGGVVRTLTGRLAPIEDNPTEASLGGMEFGASMVPVFDPAERLVCGTTVTGRETSRGWAAVQLGLDVLPFAAELHAPSVPAHIADMEARGLSMVLRDEVLLSRMAATEELELSRGVGGADELWSRSTRSGPWVPEAEKVTFGGTVTQSKPGSCVSAVGEMLTNGAVSEEQFLSELGEWSNPEALAEELNKFAEWVGGYVTEEDAVRVANRGRMGATLYAQGGKSMHMVSIESTGTGTFAVEDPLPGVCYEVDEAWVRQYVSGGVWKK
jgi:RHS repeat-associated protein